MFKGFMLFINISMLKPVYIHKHIHMYEWMNKSWWNPNSNWIKSNNLNCFVVHKHTNTIQYNSTKTSKGRSVCGENMFLNCKVNYHWFIRYISFNMIPPCKSRFQANKYSIFIHCTMVLSAYTDTMFHVRN